MADLAEMKKDLWQEIFGNKDILYCYNCGTCLTGCPASNANPPLMIRNLIRMVILGLEDDLLDQDTPWVCVTCSRCEEMCPMDVKPFEVCLAIRKWQSLNDPTRIPPSIVELFHRGYTQAVGKNTEQRKSLGLPEQLPTLDLYPDLLDKFQKMLLQTRVINSNDYMFKGSTK